MARTLSNGFILPEDGDFGNTWFDDLEANIQRVNDHNHDGANSSNIPSTAIVPVVVTLAAADFVADPAGFTAVLTTNSTINLDERSLYFRDAVTKQQVFLDFERVSSASYNVFTNTAKDYEVLLG